MNKLHTISMAISLFSFMIIHADSTQSFDFERRYGPDSPILNSASYFNNRCISKTTRTPRAAQKQKRTYKKKNRSRIKKNKKA